MNTEQIWLVATGAVALGSLLVALVATGSAHRLRAETDRSRATEALLEERLAHLEASHQSSRQASLERRPAPVADYVITAIDQVPATTQQIAPAHIEGRLFVDIVARESVVKAAGFAAGLRRALDPETRNRIRFEMRRELKRARKQRRSDVKAALRDFAARGRADLDDIDEGAA